VLLDRLDRSIRDERSASSALGAPVISRIPAVGRRAQASIASPGSARDAAYQALAATSIATDQLPRAIVVTSPTGEVQDSVAANFAVALAGLGLQVALVGTDDRQSWFVEDAPTAPSLTLPDLLTLAHGGRLNGPVRDSLVPTHLDNLRVVAPGDTSPDLLLDGLPALLQALADGGVDVTVLAGPAFLEDPSATILAWSTRSVLWSIETGTVTTDEAHDAASRLALAGGSPFGVALVDGKD
jgi:Mrp family chromosome partitioning ATPase